MKKKYIAPEISASAIDALDIITVSIDYDWGADDTEVDIF